MKTIIIPDLHNRVNLVEPVLSSPLLQPYDSVVLLGDYFDDFYDTVIDIANSAEWLKHSLYKPNRIHLFGTHDVWYRFPNNPFVKASGNTKKKSDVINRILTQKDWSLLRPYYYEQGFLLSHAGVHKYLINQYVLKNKQIFDKYKTDNNNTTINLSAQEIIDKIIKPATDEALRDVSNGRPNPWLDAGIARGGIQPTGGITWLDWFLEFEPIPGLNQIVGHSEAKIPSEKITANSRNYCLDTRSAHVGILENGKLTYLGTLDVLEAIK